MCIFSIFLSLCFYQPCTVDLLEVKLGIFFYNLVCFVPYIKAKLIKRKPNIQLNKFSTIIYLCFWYTFTCISQLINYNFFQNSYCVINATKQYTALILRIGRTFKNKLCTEAVEDPHLNCKILLFMNIIMKPLRIIFSNADDYINQHIYADPSIQCQ